jgi:lysophospholipase L1-like esterase
MRYVFLIFLAALALNVFSQKLLVKSPVRFLALGDSYTIGQSVPIADRWPNQLLESLKNKGIETEKLTIIAQTGWRTDNLLEAISREKPDSMYNLVSLLIGVNNQYQRKNIDVYPVEFRQLLETAIAQCGGRKESVFVLSIPDYGFTPFGQSSKSQISAEIDQYNQINRDITRKMGIAYYNITPISREALNKTEYVAFDGLHPSRIMYAKWIELILDSSEFEIYTSNALKHGNAQNTLVYPNPASTNITISTPQKENSIVIYNGQGSVIWQADEMATEKFNIDVSGWNNGIYYYQIWGNRKVFISGKFVVE